ncbi:uncharacterized membrane protein YhaH (DUF805 family) [Rhizobium sp. BK529]|uniref:DUF805 domain-containing protein n=1 Tax=unclassified Rhizobium TaxID=2613769 RepID=UPI00104D4C83|nr:MULTISPECIES: DUF805 domain-containing protein [unclassified Rhizobium]MBB3590648.1 uncharacterized membrane protein YhaH (DUF805 family) [Rhizobium sp. BK529]TCS05340.1 uncharacterized membrane protein YhaH (DUF805 family) [Rhizobium sp. BK418]
MGFTEAVRTVLTQKYITFSGRASRSEFWWFQLFNWLVGGLFSILGILTGANGAPWSSTNIFSIIGGLYALATLLPMIALLVRRFHDRNISGWWVLGLFVVCFIPLVGLIAAIAFLVICVLRGTEGPNRFGPDPLRPEARAEVFA